MKTNIHFWSYLAQFFIEWEMFQTKVLEEIRTNILCSINFFFLNRDVCEIWKKYVEWGRLQMTIWRMRIAWWIPKSTERHSEYVILIAFPLQQWLHERASMVRYTYTACLVCTLNKSVHSVSEASAGKESSATVTGRAPLSARPHSKPVPL